MLKLFAAMMVSAVMSLDVTAAPQPAPNFPVAAQADTALYRQYVGKYAMRDAPFQTVIVTLEGGKLMGEAVDQGKGELVPDEKNADQFSVPGYDALVVFNRDADKTVKKVLLTVQGQTFEGEKQP